ncbi:hypothetical protein SKAU_G00314420 [Synaphobranchus kaupii]|uniref:Uncharacterized protein n=1 Tax=Synaphobranchus kaupii TaxID=118154 RepID=A0A9Q1ILD6_SYNKA|nr:hypothetical protein SKAU_G00314420 [Synaphobranchus kaupii]
MKTPGYRGSYKQVGGLIKIFTLSESCVHSHHPKPLPPPDPPRKNVILSSSVPSDLRPRRPQEDRTLQTPGRRSRRRRRANAKENKVGIICAQSIKCKRCLFPRT